MLDVVCLDSCPIIKTWGLIKRNASITTFPFTLWIGSTTTATARWLRASKLFFEFEKKKEILKKKNKERNFTCCVFISTLDNQQPKPGWLWYQPTTCSGLIF